MKTATTSISFRKHFLLFFLIAGVTFAHGQTIVWSDNFIQGQTPTPAQCNNWTNFLTQLSPGLSYQSVKISGTFDPVGLKITNPAAATALATLLHNRTNGSVTSDGHTWYVGLGCQQLTNCMPGGQGVVLTVDEPNNCTCNTRYTIRPHIENSNWGGIGTNSCGAPSQMMRLEFDAGANITASGPTAFCEGGSVTLTANSNQCTAPYTYLWNTGETTQSITVSQSGNYSVVVNSSNGCVFGSNTINVTVNPNPTVNAGEDVTTCNEPVQLTAVGNGSGVPDVVTKLCLFDAPGGANNCAFTGSLCGDGYAFQFTNEFTASTSVANPASIQFKLYYTPCTNSTTFTFKVNGNVIGSLFDDFQTCTCEPSSFGQYPKTVSIGASQFMSFWNGSGSNNISVHIAATGGGTAVAGVTAEILSLGETYSWSPAAGLSNASISNPTADPTVSTTYSVTYTVNGCSATDQVRVNVVCNEPPVAVCQTVTVSANENCEANVAAVDLDGGSTDPDGDELTFSVDPPGPYPVGSTDVQLTVTDPDGASSTCFATINVLDLTPPTIAVLPDIHLPACVATASWDDPAAADNCAGVTITRVGPESGSVFDNGSTTTVTYTATDAAGNQASSSFTVTRAEVLTSASSATAILCNGGTSTVTVTATGGTAPYNGTGEFTVGAGTHTFPVIDADGCTTSTTLVIGQPSALAATITTSNSSLYFGYAGDQTAVITVTPAGGTAPYSASITMVNGEGGADTRVLICNVNGGSESWTSGANTSSTVNACGVKPVSTSNNNLFGGDSYSVTVSLMADARFVATITDANGCVYTIPYDQGARVDAEDVRCFAGSSGNQKVMICHRTGSPKNPCVSICVDAAAVAEHISHGDFYGGCNATCTDPQPNARIAVRDDGDLHNEVAIAASPNPFKSTLAIEISNPDQSPVNMQMIDATGRNVNLKMSVNREESVYLLDTDHVQPGLYFLRVNIGDAYNSTIKLMKE